MRLSTRARYALRMMLEIARQSNGNTKVSLRQIAADTNLPRRYMEQLVIEMKKAALIKGTAGKGGGYLLTRSAERIRVGVIIEAAIGPISIVECIRRPNICVQSDYCECRPVYVRINNRIIEILNDFTLADLLSRNQVGEPNETLPETIFGTTTGCPVRKKITLRNPS